MSKRRNKPRKQRRSDLLSKRRDQFQTVLTKLNVAREFEQLPMWAKKQIWLTKRPRPAVILDPDVERDRNARAIKASLERVLDSSDLSWPDQDVSVSIAQYWMLVLPLLQVLNNPANLSAIPGLASLAERLKSLLDEPARDRARIETALELSFTLSWYGRIDSALYTITPEQEKLPHRPAQIVIRVRRHPARTIRIKKRDHDPIRGYQPGRNFPGGVKWLTWEPAEVGLDTSGGPYPVFVSSHALRRYEQRFTLKTEPDVYHDWINISLCEPKVAKAMSDGQFLVAHHFMRYTTGYWRFEFEDGRFVANTFLFLTMEGTPEGDRLWHKLRMRQDDREWTALDKMATFLASDIREDAELRDILAECGCGHLFELAEKLKVPALIKGCAADVRKHLGVEKMRQALARIRARPGPRADEPASDSADFWGR